MDGATPTETGAGFIEALQSRLTRWVGKIASILGRISWTGIRMGSHRAGIPRHVIGDGEKATDPVAAAKRSYERA